MNRANEYFNPHLKRFIFDLALNKKDAYSLSIPLIASAFLNDHDCILSFLKK